jgi:hypothetical protein
MTRALLLLLGFVASFCAAAAEVSVDLSAAPGASVTTELIGGTLRIRVPAKAVVRVSDATYTAASEMVIDFPSVTGSVKTTNTGNSVKVTFGATAAAPATTVAAAQPKSAPVESNNAGSAKAEGLDVFGGALKTALETYRNYTVDMSVPATPAFAVLGVAPKTLIDPGSPRDFAASFVSKLSNSDNLGDGVGFDIVPYTMLFGKSLTLQQYRESLAVRLAARTQLSFGAIKTGSGATKTTRTAVGVAVPIIDEGDPRMDGPIAGCIERIFDEKAYIKKEDLTAAYKALDVGDREGVVKAMQGSADALAAAAKPCRDDFRKKHWNATRWAFGAGQAFENGSGTGTHASNRSFWTSYALRLGPLNDDRAAQGQLLLHLRGTDRERVDEPADARGFTLRRSVLAGVGGKFGAEEYNVSAEASWRRARYDTGERESSRKLAIGGELKVTKDMWLVLSVGGEGGLAHGKNSPFVLGSVKYGFGTEPSGDLGPPGNK